jgi:hypothetical protein
MSKALRDRIEVRAGALTLPSLRDGGPSPLQGEG